MFETVVTQAQGVAVAGLDRAALTDLVVDCRRVKAAVVALEARLVTAIDGLDDAGVNGAGVLRSFGRMSDRAATSLSKTAAGLVELPKVAESLASGRITDEHAKAAVKAAEHTSTELVEDELLKIAEATPASVFDKRARDWQNQHRSNDDGVDVLKELRQRRTVKEWVNDAGMSVLLAELDPVDAAAVKAAVDARCDQLWRDDGGRDGTPDDVRSWQQRRCDALVSLICETNPNGSVKLNPKMQLCALVDFERLRAHNPTGVAQLLDGQPLPQPALELLACNSAITGVVFKNGEPIWVGRQHRHATHAQTKALIARDKGCIGCSAGIDRCEAHHIIAWQDNGSTDITNLVLVCKRCHHNIHDRGHRVVKTNIGYQIVPGGGPSTNLNRQLGGITEPTLSNVSAAPVSPAPQTSSAEQSPRQQSANPRDGTKLFDVERNHRVGDPNPRDRAQASDAGFEALNDHRVPASNDHRVPARKRKRPQRSRTAALS